MRKLLLASIAALSINANAEVTAYVGVTNFHRAADGQWIQEGFANTIKIWSLAASIDYVFASTEKWSYKVGAAYLGKVTSIAQAVRDPDYNLKTKKCYTGAKCTMVTYNGSGTVGGITLSAARNYGQWFVEPGLIIERGTWQVDMPDWTDDNEPRFHHHVEHKLKGQLFPTLAIGYRPSEHTVIKLYAVPTVLHGGGFPALYNGVSLNLTAGYKF